MSEKELAERLAALAVWPISVADCHGDVMTSRQVDMLYTASAAMREAVSALNEVERYRTALEEVKRTLETGQPAICCTVWAVSSQAETLLDHVAAALKELS